MVGTDRNNTQDRRPKLWRSSHLQLVLSNILVIAWAVYARWDGRIVVWVYWAQSVIIGIFWFLRIVSHQHLYRRDKLGIDGRPLPLAGLERLGMGLFFLIHYGAFHLVYLLFVASGFFSREQEPFFPALAIAVTGCVFFVSELLSFVKDPNRIQRRVADMSLLMGYPYGRILPMHITIMAGAWIHDRGLGGEWLLPIFLVLKMLADIGGQMKLEQGFAGRELKAALRKRPRVQKSPYGDKLVLSDGREIDLSEHPQLARNIEGIFKLPAEVREEVVQGLLHKESQAEQPEPVQCRCGEAEIVKGAQAHIYAERHLRLLYEVGEGFTLFVCPQTGKRWIKAGDVLRAKENNK